MKIVAFDLSLTSTGWATGPDEYGRLVPPKGQDRGMARIDWIATRVNDMARYADVVALEGYSFGSKGRAVFSIAEMGGVVRFLLYSHGHRYVDVPPSTLKKYATGKGNAGNDMVLVEAVKRLGYTGSSNDEADALWLWHLAAGAYGVPGAVTVPKSHTETKKPIQWPIMEKVA